MNILLIFYHSIGLTLSALPRNKTEDIELRYDNVNESPYIDLVMDGLYLSTEKVDIKMINEEKDGFEIISSEKEDNFKIISRLKEDVLRMNIKERDDLKYDNEKKGDGFDIIKEGFEIVNEGFGGGLFSSGIYILIGKKFQLLMIYEYM